MGLHRYQVVNSRHSYRYNELLSCICETSNNEYEAAI